MIIHNDYHIRPSFSVRESQITPLIMARLTQINVLRRKLMSKITGGMPGSDNTEAAPKNSSEIHNILLCRPNHRLGNMLLITPLVQELMYTYPNARIDLFVKGAVAPIIFKNYVAIDQIIALPKKHFSHIFEYMASWAALRRKNYDLVINVETDSSSGRLATKFAKSKFKFFGFNEAYDTTGYTHIAKYPVYNLRKYIRNSNPLAAEVPLLDLKLSASEVAHGKSLLFNIVKNDRKTICLFTYATGGKIYDTTWWNDFLALLQQQYPKCNIIEILPVENVSQIDFQIPTFYSKQIREIGSVLANAVMFIGADSGMMHLSVASQCPTVGLFSDSSLDKYGPYGGTNFAVDTKLHSTAECINLITLKFGALL